MENSEFKVTSGMLAVQGDRFINYVIDVIVIYAIIFTLGVALAALAGIFQSDAVLIWIDGIGDGEGYLIFFTVSLLYYGLMETLLSQTVGKFVTKTMVVMRNGTKPGAVTILKRSFCRLIPFDPLTFLGAGRGWHDTIPDVYLVKKAAFERSKELFYAFDEIGAEKTVEA